MSWWTAGAIVGSALIGSSASKSAGESQANAAREASALSDAQFQQTRQDQMPFLQAGVRALGKLESASDYTPFGMDQFTADPGYAFRLKEGQKALDAQVAARGGLISGGALKAATRYGQEMGSQEYTNAFNRYQTNRANQLQPLQSLQGGAVTAANTIGQAGQAYATNAGNALMSAGDARASGYMGTANAISGAVGQGINYYQNQQYINKLRPQNTQTTAVPSGSTNGVTY